MHIPLRKFAMRLVVIFWRNISSLLKNLWYFINIYKTATIINCGYSKSKLYKEFA